MAKKSIRKNRSMREYMRRYDALEKDRKLKEEADRRANIQHAVLLSLSTIVVLIIAMIISTNIA